MDLWSIQDTLKAALKEQASGVPVGLGYPATLQPRHLWIEGNSTGGYEYDLTGGGPSEESYTLKVRGYVAFAGTYEECRERLAVLWDAVSAAVFTLAPSSVSHAAFGAWEVNEGVTPEGTRQLAFRRDIDVSRW